MRVKYFLFFILINTTFSEEKEVPPDDPGARTWSHIDGRKIKPGIVDANASKVTLRAPNGIIGSIPLSDLGIGDQEYIKISLTFDARMYVFAINHKNNI